MSHTSSPSVQCPYGVVRVCQEWGLSRATFYHQRSRGDGPSVERTKRGLKKEQLLWVRTFQTVEELRQALLDGVHLYNEQWLIERHGFRSPSQVRRDLLVTPEAA